MSVLLFFFLSLSLSLCLGRRRGTQLLTGWGCEGIKSTMVGLPLPPHSTPPPTPTKQPRPCPVPPRPAPPVAHSGEGLPSPVSLDTDQWSGAEGGYEQGHVRPGCVKQEGAFWWSDGVEDGGGGGGGAGRRRGGAWAEGEGMGEGERGSSEPTELPGH